MTVGFVLGWVSKTPSLSKSQAYLTPVCGGCRVAVNGNVVVTFPNVVRRETVYKLLPGCIAQEIDDPAAHVIDRDAQHGSRAEFSFYLIRLDEVRIVNQDKEPLA